MKVRSNVGVSFIGWEGLIWLMWYRKIPYVVALRKQHGGCAALLNPSSAEPLVWPSYLKFMSELTGEAKALLECALMEADREKESASDCAADSLSEASDTEVCGICFEEACTIQVQECGHTMCAHCTLALCCHNKPNPNQATLSPCAPVCPFCRSSIVKLVATASRDGNLRKPRKSRRSGGGSSSFKGIGRVGRSSGRIAPQDEWLDKPLSLEDWCCQVVLPSACLFDLGKWSKHVVLISLQVSLL